MYVVYAWVLLYICMHLCVGLCMGEFLKSIIITVRFFNFVFTVLGGCTCMEMRLISVPIILLVI